MQQPETVAGAAPPEAGTPRAVTEFSANRFAVIFALGVLAAFPGVLLGLSSFVVRDFGFFAYPLAHYQRECFWTGELPLWNPYNHCGIPFLAQWNTMPLYPPALIYLILPLPWSLNFFCLAHLFWAGLGMYFLGRRWTGSGLAGAVAGMAFGYNGFALNLLMWPSHIATYSWMPWVVLLVEAGWNEGGRRLFLGALAGALQMLAGGPETILFTWVVLSVMWVSRLASGGSGERQSVERGERESGGAWWQVGWRFPFMVVLVAGLAAAQLLPFLDLAAHSQREQGFADARWSMPASGWANFLVPMLSGSVGKQKLFYQYGQYWTSSYYVGIGVLVLTLAALVRYRQRRVWLLAAIAVVGVVLAMGDQTLLSRWARHAIPQLSLTTYPVKYVALAVFALPVLAAFGVAGLQRADRKRGWVLWGAAGIVLAMTVGVLIWARRAPTAGDAQMTLWNGVGRICVLVLTATALGFVFGERSGQRRGWAGQLAVLALLVLFWVDVRTHEPQQNPSVPGWVFTPGLARTRLSMNPQPELWQSRAMVSPTAEAKFRELVMNDPKDNFLVKRLGYFANCNLLDRVPTVNGFFSLAPKECGELNSLLYVNKWPYGAPLADFLGVSQTTSTEENTMWDPRPGFMPFATAGQAPVFLNDTNALGVLLSTNFDASRFVLLAPEARSWITATNPATAQVTVTKAVASRIELDVDAAAPTLVTVAQTYYHCWKARVDGRAEPLLRANFGFQAVPVPAGRHRLTLSYEDRAFRAGLGITGVSLLAGLAGWLVCLRKAAARLVDSLPAVEDRHEGGPAK